MLEIYPLKYLEAEELASLLGLILNVQPASPGGGRSPSASPVRVSMPSMGGAMPMPIPGGAPPSLGDVGGGGGGGSPPSASSCSPKETVEIAANDRSNSLLILSSEGNFEAIKKLATGLDTEDAMEKMVRTFPLKNADAEDVAKQLQDLNHDQDSSSRYPYYIFSSMGGNKASSKKLSVVADRRRNSLIVQAPPA